MSRWIRVKAATAPSSLQGGRRRERTGSSGRLDLPRFCCSVMKRRDRRRQMDRERTRSRLDSGRSSSSCRDTPSCNRGADASRAAARRDASCGNAGRHPGVLYRRATMANRAIFSYPGCPASANGITSWGPFLLTARIGEDRLARRVLGDVAARFEGRDEFEAGGRGTPSLPSGPPFVIPTSAAPCLLNLRLVRVLGRENGWTSV